MSDKYNFVKDHFKRYMDKLWAVLTKRRNIKITHTTRVNLHFIKAHDTLEMIQETTTKSTPIVSLMRPGTMTNRLGTERLRVIAWRELRSRKENTTELLRRVKNLRARQVELLREAAAVQAQQLEQLEEISTELWNAWQTSLELSK